MSAPIPVPVVEHPTLCFARPSLTSANPMAYCTNLKGCTGPHSFEVNEDASATGE